MGDGLPAGYDDLMRLLGGDVVNAVVGHRQAVLVALVGRETAFGLRASIQIVVAIALLSRSAKAVGAGRRHGPKQTVDLLNVYQSRSDVVQKYVSVFTRAGSIDASELSQGR